MKITYINIFLLLFFLVSCENQLDNRNYFVCDHTEFDTTLTLIVDTKNKEFLLGANLINEDFTEEEVVIEATKFCCGGNKRFKDVFSFNKLEGTFKALRYSRIETEKYKLGYVDTYKCVKTEPLID